MTTGTPAFGKVIAADHDNERKRSMSRLSPDSPELRAHPLAVALIRRLENTGGAVLEIGPGSGRNTAALRAAGLRVSHEPVASAFDAALSTHALLHGTPTDVANALDAIAAALKPGAPLYATFGSQRDARFGRGTRVDARTFAPNDGDERGVAHCYFDEPVLRALLETHFSVESMEETSVDDVVGRWAHAQPPSGSVHWFVRSVRRN